METTCVQRWKQKEAESGDDDCIISIWVETNQNDDMLQYIVNFLSFVLCWTIFGIFQIFQELETISIFLQS